VMQAERGLARLATLAAYQLEGIAGYQGPMSHESVLQSHKHWLNCAAHEHRAEAAAPDSGTTMMLHCFLSIPISFPRQHALAEFSLETLMLGEDGSTLRQNIERYDFETAQTVTHRQLGIDTDVFLFGLDALGLLLWRGDVRTMRAGVVKVLDGHRRLLAQVRQGEVMLDRLHLEGLFPACGLVPALLAAGELDSLREFMAHSLFGACLEDEGFRTGFSRAWKGLFGWRTEDGHCLSTLDTFLMMVRGLAALLDENTDASRAALREWLPPPAELLRITVYECAWRAHSYGANHPALLCARLHGERLGGWAVTVEVAEGVLSAEQFNPLLRTEALRLLGRAHAALGRRGEACAAAERAVAEAAGARYVWLELLSLRDLLEWSEDADAAGVRSRLAVVEGRLASRRGEMTGVQSVSIQYSCR